MGGCHRQRNRGRDAIETIGSVTQSKSRAEQSKSTRSRKLTLSTITRGHRMDAGVTVTY